MAKVRTRPETGTLYLDFSYRGVRCREQTTLLDTAANRRRVQALMNRIQKEIKQGSFDYAVTFPESSKAAQFTAQSALSGRQPGSGHPPTSQAPVTPSFAEFSVTWRQEMAPQWRLKHRDSVDIIFDAHLLTAFGDQALSAITKADVLTFRAHLAKLPGRGNETLAPATINKIVGILRQCLAEASDRFALPDVFKGIRRLKTGRPQVQPFSLKEVQTIRSSIRADYCDYITARFFTGMRTGEINGLKWKQVDFDKGLILVRETFSGGVVEENAKTDMSLRDIPMLPIVREALESQWENRHPDSEYVFCSRNGLPIDAHNFANRVWYPLLRFLGFEKRRPYQTRHTAATLMLASGENPEWIAYVMGHANTQMLFTVYSRYVPNLTRQDGRAITGLLNANTHTKNSSQPDAATLKKMSVDQLRSTLLTLLNNQAPQ